MTKFNSLLVFLVSACALANCQSVAHKDSSKPGANENLAAHFHVHKNETIHSSDVNIARDESAFFVSALFKKYNDSSQLSLDGFVRLLCRIGLVPFLTDGAVAGGNSEADDSSNQGENQRSSFCNKLTFDEVPLSFDILQIRTEDNHDNHNRHDHSDDHADHDHQPNDAVRNNVTSPQDNDDHNHEEPDHDHRDHDDHAHLHDHDHHGNRTRRGVDDDSNAESTPALQQKNLTKVHMHSTHQKKCSSPKELLEFFHIQQRTLSVEDFTFLCPALLYELESGDCGHVLDDRHHHEDHGDDERDHDHHDEVKVLAISNVSVKVWGYSTAAVLVISLAGLLGVAVIPIMQKVFYNHLLQFLVAIAVGALSGDALLHLLPHAISKNQAHNHDASHNSHYSDHSSSSSSSKEDHLDAVWKGLVALICIFFFFLVERILTIVTEKKRRKKAMSRLKKKRCERLCDAERGSKVGAKLSAHDDGDYADCEQMVMVVHPNRALKAYADATHDVLMHQCDESLSHTGGGEPNFNNDNDDDNNHTAEDTNSHTPLGHSPHAHSHSQHGHSHFGSVPGSVAAVAWMVIFGDGIHNFSDGLAIGAAFANGVTGGVSTSIAVFCHELPHEIGDFAVLLRAGMSVKQAVVYNCVSSVLCFIGMLVGVAIGNIQNASLWVFAGVGGMFIYISMVDMLPEMTAVDTKKGENHFLHLLLQVGGMMIGSGIMLIIAVFEHDLQMMLG